MKKKSIQKKIDFEVNGLNNLNRFPLLGQTCFPLLGQLVLVTSINRDQIPNVTHKSRVSVFASRPAIVGFGCNLSQETAKNILSTGEFVINIPGRELAAKVWKAAESNGKDKEQIERMGLTPLKSVKVSTPRIAECKAHLECALDWTKKYGDEVVILGRILLASIDQKAVEGTLEQRHKYLKLMTYLDNGAYGEIKTVKKIEQS